jgi:glycosyltransferase involved in cell wall biosynthesis
MRLLFLISDDCWTARGRVFVSAARGLAARKHQTLVACESECPVQAQASQAGVEVVSLDAKASGAGDALRLRRALNDRNVDVIFVHTDAEHMIASSAARLGAGAAAVVRRVPPFSAAGQTRTGRIASRVTPSALLYSTEADRQAEAPGGGRLPSGVAPLGVDISEHDAVRAQTKAALGAPAGSTLIVCVHDGVDRARALTALRVVSLLSPRHPELHLAIVGAGATDELRMHGAALGVNPLVSYLGTRDDELSILAAADVGWIAAEADAAALAALDFMAFRVPVVAERAPVTEHYIADGMTGVHLPVADASTTAAAVAAFLAKTEERKAMGNAGRARLERDFPYDGMLLGFESMAAAAGQRLAHPQRAG